MTGERQGYRVVIGPYYRPSELARARRWEHLGDALRVMGEGMVLNDDGEVAAFHERHLETLTRMERTCGAYAGLGTPCGLSWGHGGGHREVIDGN